MIRKKAQERRRLRELQDKGKTDASSTPETTCEENSTQILTSSQGDKIQAFVQDSLDAHPFLEKQSKQGLLENQPASKHLETEQAGQLLMREQLDEDTQDHSPIPHTVREEKGREKVPADEQGSTVGHMLETEKEDKQEKQSTRNEAEREQSKNKQPPLPEADDDVPVHGPGPRITELQDAELLETIHLPPASRSLRIDELPDLEDVNTEDFNAVFSCKQAFKPKIEVISGDSNEEAPAGIQSDSISTSAPAKSFLFLMSGCDKSPAVSGNSTSLVYPEDEGAPSDPPNSKINRTSSPPRCLIEELE
ncbi:unnamed protein product [Oreochromis niloticus]|nr:unnamed protein product [Mustela putorius furo]